MAKLPVMSGEHVCAILAKHGFVRVRQRGSHIVMQRRSETGTITAIVPDHAELKRGTLMSIIRQSGLAKDDFEN